LSKINILTVNGIGLGSGNVDLKISWLIIRC